MEETKLGGSSRVHSQNYSNYIIRATRVTREQERHLEKNISHTEPRKLGNTILNQSEPSINPQFVPLLNKNHVHNPHTELRRQAHHKAPLIDQLLPPLIAACT